MQFSCCFLMFLAVLLCLGQFLLVPQVQAANDEALAQYQKIFVKQQSKNISKLLEMLDKDKETFKADTNFSSANYLSPQKKHMLVTISRVSPDKLDNWLVIVMNTKTLAVERVFDFLKATGIEKIQWLNENEFILLSQNTSLCGPPGELFIVNAMTSTAVKIDDHVWRYFINASESDYIFYEKSVSTKATLSDEDLYNERQLVARSMSSKEFKVIHTVKHPVTQFGDLGPLQSGGSFFKFDVQTYGETFEPDVVTWWYDLMTGKTFVADNKATEKTN